MNTNIKKARLAAGLSQSKLATLAGVSKQTISNAECGVYVRPSLDTLLKIAKALKVTVDSLLD